MLSQNRNILKENSTRCVKLPQKTKKTTRHPQRVMPHQKEINPSSSQIFCLRYTLFSFFPSFFFLQKKERGIKKVCQ